MKKEIIEIPDQITDDFIKQVFVAKSGRIPYHFERLIDDKIADYLNTRYDETDTGTFKEIIFRIKNGIEETPRCPICGKPCKFVGRRFLITCESSICREEQKKQTCLERYGVTMFLASAQGKESIKKTCLERHGCEFPSQIPESREKTRQTNLEKYGADSYLKTEEGKQKVMQTNLNRYGTAWYFGSDDYKEKTENTLNTKYAEEGKHFINPGQVKIVKDKIRKTCQERFGYESPIQSPEIIEKIQAHYKTGEAQKKCLETKKKNGTINTSKTEKLFMNYLEDHFHNDFEYQHKNELYPYNCDFYIKSLDLYIEIQGTWKHGGKAHEGLKEDIELIEEWKSRASDNEKSDYLSAINVWTISDVKKRETAKRNNLNYLEIFSCKIEEVIEQFEKYVLENYEGNYRNSRSNNR